MFSFVWWIVGFYWITAGGQALPTEAPHLYWYTQALSKTKLCPWALYVVSDTFGVSWLNATCCWNLRFFFSDFSWSWQDSLRRIREMRVIVNLCGNCRLCMVFLAFDVFFVVFCVALACVIGIAVCCCLPCIIAILYAVADQVCSLSLSPSHSLHQPSIPCPALCL